jgi:hypothetical protein
MHQTFSIFRVVLLVSVREKFEPKSKWLLKFLTLPPNNQDRVKTSVIMTTSYNHIFAYCLLLINSWAIPMEKYSMNKKRFNLFLFDYHPYYKLPLKFLYYHYISKFLIYSRILNSENL